MINQEFFSEDQARRIRAENNDRLWEVFCAYENDLHGLNKEQLIELAEFNRAEGIPLESIFKRALAVCRKRAESVGKLIPHSTQNGKNGYVYVLESIPNFAVDGFAAAARKTAGMRKLTVKQQKFIDTDTSQMTPVARASYEALAGIMQKQADRETEMFDEQVELVTTLHRASREEAQQSLKAS